MAQRRCRKERRWALQAMFITMTAWRVRMTIPMITTIVVITTTKMALAVTMIIQKMKNKHNSLTLC